MSQNKRQSASQNDSNKTPSGDGAPAGTDKTAGGQAASPAAKTEYGTTAGKASADKPTGGAKAATSQPAGNATSGAQTSGAKAQGAQKPSAMGDSAKASATGKNTGSTKTSAASSGGAGAGSRGSGSGGAKGTGKNLALIIAIVALVVAVLSVAAAAWLYVQSQSRAAATSEQIDSATANVKSQVEQQLGPRVQGIGQSLSDVSDQLRGIDKRVGAHDDALTDLQSTVEQVRRQNRQLQDALGGNNDTLIQQRVAALLETAQQRLTIYRDPAGTLAALKSADQTIARSGAGGLRPVRQAIAQEIAAVQSLPNPDVEGLALQLSQLIERVPKLPTQSHVPGTFDRNSESGADESAGPSDAGNEDASANLGLAGIDWKAQWQRLTDRAGQALSSMVSVRRANGTQNAPTLMAPDQAFFLVENVQLSLRSARLALLAGNENTYTSSLSDAADAIRRYFDTDASATKGMLSSIDELKRVSLAWEAPDISDSLTRLNRIMRDDAAGDTSGASTPSPSANDDTTDGAADQGGA